MKTNLGMKLGQIMTALDAVSALRDAARRYKAATARPTYESNLPQATGGQAFGGQMEARLTNVVVAALKEAFDRDHARTELERSHLDEERRRAERLLSVELQRQAVDRELSRLRMLAATAMVGWIASMVMFVTREASSSTPARAIIAAGWMLLLGALAAAFNAQPKVTIAMADDRARDAGAAGVAALWLLIAGLAATAISLLF